MGGIKRRRLNSMETQHMDSISYLTSLNDHCILQIFEWLELNTLCVVGETCKTLNRLVVAFFQQKYHNKMMSEVRIQVTFDGRIVLSPVEKYVTYFLKFMQNITLGGGYQKRPLDVLTFIQKNCKKNIRQIAFEDVKFNKLHGAVIIDWLKTVESVAFFGCENIHEILRYCGNFRNLKIDKYSKDGSNKWLRNKYSTLEHLQYDQLRDQSTNVKLIAFLKNNPNVKSLMLDFDRSSLVCAGEEILHQLHATGLEELLLTFVNSRNLASIGYQFCSRSCLKRLQLCFQEELHRPDDQFNWLLNLNKLKCLEGLHLLYNDHGLPTNMRLEHLKVLRMEYVSSVVSTDIILKNLPNLEELYVMHLVPDLKEFVMPFVRNAVKLNKIVAREIKIQNRMEMTNHRLAKYLNDERGKLMDPCKVIIYIGKDEYDASFDTMPSNFDLVEIRQVEFQNKRVSYGKPYLSNYEF